MNVEEKRKQIIHCLDKHINSQDADEYVGFADFQLFGTLLLPARKEAQEDKHLLHTSLACQLNWTAYVQTHPVAPSPVISPCLYVAMTMIADDISLQKVYRDGPPVIVPFGAFWESLEEYWSDFVAEMPEIPFGGNEHYHNAMKPKLGELSNILQPGKHT